MTVPGNIVPLLMSEEAAGGYQVERSLRFNSSDSAFLSRTPASAGNRKTWTWAGWVKLGKPSTFGVLFDAGAANTDTANLLLRDTGVLQFYAETNPTQQAFLQTSQVLRDYSAWYHIVLAIDTTQATGSNRVKFYLNGSQITAFSTASYPSQNADLQTNAALLHTIGRGAQYQPNFYFDGYLADVHFIDGQALTPSSFTEVSATTGRLEPKQYAGSFGTNGFWLKFSDNSAATATTLGKDYSGNSNNWSPTNLSVTAGAGNDSLTDTPTSYGTDTGAGGEVRGNYCTLNPLDKQNFPTFSNGNLNFLGYVGIDWGTSRGTLAASSGKWYFEVTPTSSNTASNGIGVGIASTSTLGTPSWSLTGAWTYESNSGRKALNGSVSSYGSAFTTNDVIGVAYNLDAGTLVFYKNGISQGTATSSGLPSTAVPFVACYDTDAVAVNFGQRPFAYTAPSGFKALCDQNLPAPTIARPSTVMDVKLYTGNGSTQTISGLGFSPDLVWLKGRTNSGNHGLYDTVRGASQQLVSNDTAAEATNAGVSAFNSDGFNVGPAFSQSSNAWVAWGWDAGSSTVTNTQGSISSQVRANPSAGFSIVTYTGTGANATVGHGLGIAPSLLIIKNRDGVYNWRVWHKQLSSTEVLWLNTTDAVQTGQTTMWNSTLPSSTVFSLGTNGGVNASSEKFVAYCFAPVNSYSAFGAYQGNGSSDGPFVFCGFRPRWIMIKRTDSAVSWNLFDTARDSYNAAGLYLFPNLSNAESDGRSANGLDILSNGFKWRSSGSGENASGGTFIYAAFAENPFQYARAR